MKMKLKQLEGLLGSLEQFSTPKADNSFGDISDKVVADFGCGCGTLGLAAGLLGAEHVSGLDIDAESLEIASANADDLELEMDFVQFDVRNFGWRGADMDFLFVALKNVKRTALRDYNATSAEVLCELRYDVPPLYKFHKKKEVDIAVDLWRFVPK